MPYTNKTFSVGATLPAADINNLQANFSAVASGDSEHKFSLGNINTTVKSSGVFSIGPGGTYTPASCFAQMLSKNGTDIYTQIQFNVGGAWYNTINKIYLGLINFDGANVRIYNVSSLTGYYEFQVF